jgi:hypothetical protein
MITNQSHDVHTEYCAGKYFRQTLEKASTHFSATRKATASLPPLASILIASPTFRRASAVASARIVVACASPRATLICSSCFASETRIDDCFVPEKRTTMYVSYILSVNDHAKGKFKKIHTFCFEDLSPLCPFGRDLEMHRVDDRFRRIDVLNLVYSSGTTMNSTKRVVIAHWG